MVKQSIDTGVRDTTVEIFRDLIYCTVLEKRQSMAATRSLDKSPDDMVAWISWNNAVVFTNQDAVRRGSGALAIADGLLTTRFRNTTSVLVLVIKSRRVVG